MKQYAAISAAKDALARHMGHGTEYTMVDGRCWHPTCYFARALLEERERSERWKEIATMFNDAHGTGLKSIYGAARDSYAKEAAAEKDIRCPTCGGAGFLDSSHMTADGPVVDGVQCPTCA